MKRLALALSLLIALPATGQQPQGSDFEIARDAVERGEILPLARVLALLERQHPGQVIEVELEVNDGIRVYEIELVTPDGRLIEVDMNAATGEILDYEEEDGDD
ncbi:PepSY domain-containing protein [Gemmobacter sp.]|uniref:PepSY domain-containing protein n=1 Tax=Gemmobacter sp. TaxID=1898957 RepID=UPI002AFF76D9|nr:PepSY domain-containing protein [Gemmobacter sp.]